LRPSLWVIAGQNGAGKSTFARALRLNSIDPDRIAAEFGQGFTQDANLRASRIALQQIHDRLNAQQDLVVETTLAGRQPLRLMQQARNAGYEVQLVFIVPNGREDTRLRIENRVLLGGHNIPDIDLERRAPRVLAHLPEAVRLADCCAIYGSSVRRRDFTLDGAVMAGQVQLTSAVPETVWRALEGTFTVTLVEVIDLRHPVTEVFPHSVAELDEQ